MRRSASAWTSSSLASVDKPSRPRTRREKIEGIQRTLEAYRRFDRETIPYGDNWKMPDADYHYRQPWYERIVTGFWRTLMGLLGPLLVRIAFGARVVGRKNLRAVKGEGCISVCNHFHYLDTLFVREAIGHFGSFHTMAPWNNKGGIGGHIVRHGGMWPFSANLAATKHLNAEMERRLRQGKRVNFYAEQVMWWNYQKPRPMKDGAFHYAVKFGVPVLPVFCTFSKRKGGGIKKLRIHILPAVRPDSSLPRRECVQRMRECAEAEWKQCYEEAYGIPLVYEEDRRSRKEE